MLLKYSVSTTAIPEREKEEEKKEEEIMRK
jgi:hypothetical protein